MGYVIGARGQATPALTLGISYIAELRQKLKGRKHLIHDTVSDAVTIDAFTSTFSQSIGHADLPTSAIITFGAR